MKTMRRIFESIDNPKLRVTFELQTFVHKYIALPGTLSKEAKKALKLWLIGKFYYMQIKNLSPDGYRYVMDLGAGAFGVVSIVESEDGGQIFICKVVDLESM